MDRENNTHFSETERLLLVQLVSEETCIENKRTNAVDLKEKTDAWERICKKYASEGCAPRTTKQLKKCWDNLKQRKRKLNTAMRHERLMTGGGLAEKHADDPVMDFMGTTNSNLDIELECPFDSTANFGKEYRIKPQVSTQVQKEDMIEEYRPTPSTSHRNSPSRTSNIEKSKKHISANTKNIENIQDEKVLRLIKLCESIEQQRELHAKKMQIAEVEEKIALAKLLKEEEALRQSVE